MDAWLREHADDFLRYMHARPTTPHGFLANFPSSIDRLLWAKDLPQFMREKMIRIRLGTTADMDQIMKLATAAAKENGLLEASPELLVRAIWPKLNLQTGLIGCIGRPDGIIEGMVVLQVGKLFYSDETCLEELVLYVHPDYRSALGSRAHKLIQFSKSSAEKLGIPLLIGVLSSSQTEHKRKLYERVLGPPSGNYWIYGRKTGSFKDASVGEN